MRRIRKMMESGNKEEKDGDLGALGWGLSIRRARWQLGQKPFVRQGTSVYLMRMRIMRGAGA